MALSDRLKTAALFVLRFFSPFGSGAAFITTAVAAALAAQGVPYLVVLAMWCLAIAYNIRNF